MKELPVIAIRRFWCSLAVSVSVLAAAPMLVAQQSGGVLHLDRPVADSSSGTALFPLSIAEAPSDPGAPARYQLLAHRIDSISSLAARLQAPTRQFDGIVPTASRVVLFTQLTRNLGQLNAAPSSLGTGRATYGPMDWVNVVTLAGVAGLGRSTLLSSNQSEQTVWESLRNAGQWAGMATVAGGASWLLAKLGRHSLCGGRLTCRRPPAPILYP
jgi:hypothetical protein